MLFYPTVKAVGKKEDWMFDKQYPNLAEEFRDVAELAAGLKATLARYGADVRPHEIELWTVAVAGYISVMMDFIVHLDNHPEWAEEAEKLMEPVGCPAFKIPLISQFLAEKGVRSHEGVALVINQ